MSKYLSPSPTATNSAPASSPAILPPGPSLPEGSGPPFDSTTIIYFPETGAGHHSPDTEEPIIVMTGKKSKLDLAGRYIRLPFHGTDGHQTISKWYTPLLIAYGNPIKHDRDLDQVMVQKRLQQTGPIQRFVA